MSSFLRTALVFAALAAAPSAEAADCAREAAELRAHLTEAQDKADTWNFAWRVTFTGAAVGTLAVGLADPFPSLQNGLFVSSGKATIGALARWVMPLRIRVPATSGDPCVDLAALRDEVTRVARKQRSLFWMGHVGGILVNLGGAVVLWHFEGLGDAALSVAVGYPVGVLSNYTMPRGTWKLYREREATWEVTSVVAAPRAHGGWVFGIGGTF